MGALNNTNLKDGLCGCSCAGFAPSVTYAISSANITFTSTGTFDSGDTLNVIRASVFDKNGKEASNQNAAGAAVVVDCSGLDLSKVTLKAFVLSTGGCKADLQLSEVIPSPTTSGTLGSINEQGDNVPDGNN